MDREQALKLLRGGTQGIQQWNWMMTEGEAELPDLYQADLSGANLHEATLYGADLSEANLGKADLTEADLTEADLSGANLSRAKLSRAKLSRAKLSGVILREADLCVADLTEANLSGANFIKPGSSWLKLIMAADLGGANLSGANFIKADLSGANLSNANLGGANLGRANLSGANLSGADLSGAAFGVTVITNVDLSEVLGLGEVQHEAPSSVGIDTLFRSGGKIPPEFLRGCGMPEQWIEYLPSLVGMLAPIQFYSCFISYSTKDEDFAKRLHSRMRDEGLRVWYSPEDIKGGQKLDEQIDEAIREYEKLLLVISPNSMNSPWVKTEIRKAWKIEVKEGKRKLFPIRLVPFEEIERWKSFYADLGEDLAEEIREYFIPDFVNWTDPDAFEKAFNRLLDDLKAGKMNPPEKPQ